MIEFNHKQQLASAGPEQVPIKVVGLGALDSMSSTESFSTEPFQARTSW